MRATILCYIVTFFSLLILQTHAELEGGGQSGGGKGASTEPRNIESGGISPPW